jgi:hypothetical protein
MRHPHEGNGHSVLPDHGEHGILIDNVIGEIEVCDPHGRRIGDAIHFVISDGRVDHVMLVGFGVWPVFSTTDPWAGATWSKCRDLMWRLDLDDL